MADVDLPLVVSEEFISNIPRQRDQINKLMENGVVLAYSLAMDRSKLWIILKAENEAAAMEYLESMPLYEYFQIQLFPLAFHNHVALSLPEVLPN